MYAFFLYDGRANEWLLQLFTLFFFFLWLLPRGAWYFLFWQRYPPGVLLHFQRTGLDSLFSLVILLLAVYSFSGNSKFLLLDVSRISSSSLSSEFCYLFFSLSFSFPSVCIDPFFISLFYSREIGNYGESNKKKTLLITARENYKCGGYIQCERRFVLKLRPKRGREERSFIPFAFFLFLFQSSLFCRHCCVVFVRISFCSIHATCSLFLFLIFISSLHTHTLFFSSQVFVHNEIYPCLFQRLVFSACPLPFLEAQKKKKKVF